MIDDVDKRLRRLLGTAEGRLVAEAFPRITSLAQRRKLADLAVSLAAVSRPPPRPELKLFETTSNKEVEEG